MRSNACQRKAEAGDPPFHNRSLKRFNRTRATGLMLYKEMLLTVTYTLLRVSDDDWPLRQTHSSWGVPGRNFTPVRLTSSP